MTKGLYKFYRDFGRMGDLDGVFISDMDEVADLIGKYVYFGEVLGKHSDIGVTIKEDDIQLLTIDPVAVEIVSKYNLESGYNPFEYYEEEEDDE